MAKVRIRKAGPGEKPGYYNKLGKFLNKAQEGGTPSIDMLTYPGAQEEPQQMSEDQLMQVILNDISQNLDESVIVNKLVNNFGLDLQSAQSYISKAYDGLNNQETSDEESSDEESDEEVPDNEVAELENTDDYGNILPEDEDLSSDQEESAMVDSLVNEENNDIPDDNTTEFESNLIMEKGGESKFHLKGYRTKKGYVNNVLNLVKKQLGGDQEKASNDPDPIGTDLRRNTLNSFLGAIKREGNISIAKEEAQKEFDQAMQHYNMMQTPQQEKLNQFIPSNGMPEAQFGGALGRFLNAYFPANISPYNHGQYTGTYDQYGRPVVPQFGPNTTFGRPEITKKGIFGRPKEYSIQVNNPEMDPRKQRLITLPGQKNNTFCSIDGRTCFPNGRPQNAVSQKEDVSDLSLKGAMAVRQGERQMARNDRRIARHPERAELPLTPEEMAAKKMYKSKFSNPAIYSTGMSDNDMQAAQNVFSNPAVVTDYMHSFQDGGDARFGRETPVIYTNNPAMDGVSDMDLINVTPDNQVLDIETTTPDWMTPFPGSESMPTLADTNYEQPDQIEIDPNDPYAHQIKQTYAPKGNTSKMHFKNISHFNPQASLLATNAAVEDITGTLNKLQTRKNQRQMYKNLTADNLYAQQAGLNKGDYDTNSGLFRPNEQGQTWNSHSKQYGGESQYNEGDEVYMTEDELNNFLSNGGQVEYL